jgi:hypothetical protein
LARSAVRGCSLEPVPPARMIDSVSCGILDLVA